MPSLIPSWQITIYLVTAGAAAITTRYDPEPAVLIPRRQCVIRARHASHRQRHTGKEARLFVHFLFCVYVCLFNKCKKIKSNG